MPTLYCNNKELLVADGDRELTVGWFRGYFRAAWNANVDTGVLEALFPDATIIPAGPSTCAEAKANASYFMCRLHKYEVLKMIEEWRDLVLCLSPVHGDDQCLITASPLNEVWTVDDHEPLVAWSTGGEEKPGVAASGSAKKRVRGNVGDDAPRASKRTR